MTDPMARIAEARAIPPGRRVELVDVRGARWLVGAGPTGWKPLPLRTDAYPFYAFHLV